MCKEIPATRRFRRVARPPLRRKTDTTAPRRYTLDPTLIPDPSAIAVAEQMLLSEAEEAKDKKLIEAIKKAAAALRRTYSIAQDGSLTIAGSSGNYTTRGDFCVPQYSKTPCKGWLAARKANSPRGCYHCLAFELLCLAQDLDS